jgi:hypothetical protein
VAHFFQANFELHPHDVWKNEPQGGDTTGN